MLATGADAHRNGLEGSKHCGRLKAPQRTPTCGRASEGSRRGSVRGRASEGSRRRARQKTPPQPRSCARMAHRPTLSRFAMPVLRAALALITLAFAIAVFPNPALAAEVLCPQTDIVAQAQTDGSLHVTEQRVFTTDDSSVRLKWSFAGVSAGSEAEISSMRAAAVDEGRAMSSENGRTFPGPFPNKLA